MNSMRSSEIQHMMQLLSECGGLLRNGDIAGLETKIALLRAKPEEVLQDKSESGFTNHLVYGAYAGFKDNHISSSFLREISEKTDERLLYLNHLKSGIDSLEAAFFIVKGVQYFHAGEYESAFSVWENALRKAPSEETVHRCLSDFLDQADTDVPNRARLKEVAAGLRRRYCFEEDTEFRRRFESELPGAAVRCIDFDDDGAMYLDCVNRCSVVKLSCDENLEWEVCFEEPGKEGGKPRPNGFGSFCFSDGRMILCDTPNRQLIFLNKDGVTERTVSLQAGMPLFAHHVEDLRQYHITDEKTGKVLVFDDGFREIGSYKSPDDALRPVQVVRAKGANKMVLASSLILLRSALDVFDMDGNHEDTITSFSESPCHVVKLDVDDCGAIYAVDHFGRIFKINASGEVIWRYQESPKTDRFKYVKYCSPYLYLSDFLTMRRFRVDR